MCHCVQAQPLTEYPVKCEFCRETAKPLLDEQDPQVGIGFFLWGWKGLEGLKNTTETSDVPDAKDVLRVTSIVYLLENIDLLLRQVAAAV